MSCSRIRIFQGSVTFALLLTGIQASANTLISYPDFSDTSGLTLVGNTAPITTSDGTVLRITPSASYQSGAAYSTSSIALGVNDTFSTQFQFRITNPGGIDPADGITFVLAASPTGLGSNGGGLGYRGVANSVAVEFDTYNNGGIDSFSSNHVAIDTNGVLTNLALSNVYGISTCDFGTSSYAAPGCLANGDLWTAKINFNGSNLSVNLFDPAKGTTFSAISNYNINIASQLGTNLAYVGFTGSTGGGWQNQDIANWQFANTATLPASGPEPASLLLVGLGLLPFVKAVRSKLAK